MAVDDAIIGSLTGSAEVSVDYQPAAGVHVAILYTDTGALHGNHYLTNGTWELVLEYFTSPSDHATFYPFGINNTVYLRHRSTAPSTRAVYSGFQIK